MNCAQLSLLQTILVDIDLYTKTIHKLWVERDVFSFLVNINYKNLPLFGSQCHNIGHSFSSSKFVKVDQEKVGIN